MNLASVRSKGTTGLAWATLIIALIGGSFAPASPLGTLIRTLLDALPWDWAPPVLFAAAVIGGFLDTLLDMIPNEIAIGAAAVVPTMASAVPGKLGDTVEKWSADLLKAFGQDVMEWVGTASATGLTVGCLVAAFLMARRVIKKTGGTGAALSAAIGRR